MNPLSHFDFPVGAAEEAKQADVVFIGGGPVGLWTAIQSKLKNGILKLLF